MPVGPVWQAAARACGRLRSPMKGSVLDKAAAGVRAGLKRAHIGVQNFLCPFVYRARYALAPRARRITWTARSRYRLVMRLADIRGNGWLTDGAATAAIEQPSFHLCNISACLLPGQDLLYCGKLANWITGLTPFTLGAFPSAGIVFEPESRAKPLDALRVPVAAPYHCDYVEDIRLFDSHGSLWGIGSVRNLAQDRIRPIVVRFAYGGRALRADRAIVLDERTLEGKLALQAEEKNWTPIPRSPAEIHFVQDHLEGNIVTLNAQTLAADVLRPPQVRPAPELPPLEPRRSALRMPGCPVKVWTREGAFLLTVGYSKFEGSVNAGLWRRSTFYKAFAVLLDPAPPYAVTKVSKPIYFDVLPTSYVFPFQLIEIPGRKDTLLASLYIGGKHNEVLTIEKQALLDAFEGA